MSTTLNTCDGNWRVRRATAIRPTNCPLLVSFLKWSGWRLLRDEARRFLDRHPGGLRVLTTTYMGATDRRVLDDLVDCGAEVKISYDTRRTRLHAKAWLFHRDSGYSTALVGSSNLSAAAITDGLEWNVRLSHVETPQVLRQFQTAFEQYWEEGEFEAYDPKTGATATVVEASFAQ